MIRSRLRWAAALGTILAGQAGQLSFGAAPYPTPPATASNTAILGRPIAVSKPVAVLERPVVLAETLAAPIPPPAPVAPVSFEEPAVITRGQAPDGAYQTMYQPPPPPPPPTGGTAAPFGAPEGAYNPAAPYEQPLPRPNGFWGHCKDWFGGTNGNGFNCKSDGAFESLITPVSNPFYFEDPRALTEVRPLFLFQNSPKNAPIFAGGNSYFFGLQGRLALNDRWSIVVNKLGVVSFDPSAPVDGISNSTGFAELNIGPKFTFLHNTTNNTVAAFGLNLDLPIGSGTVLQNTGTLSLDPYFTIGHTFGRTSWGQFNVISTTGYTFAIDSQRSDFFHSALHLDYDIASAHKWYPLVELNWFHYTTAGQARDINLEGIDLGNFGSTGVAGRNILNLAAGFRYKFNEHTSVGVAAELPLVHPQDIQKFRMTFDLIFRY